MKIISNIKKELEFYHGLSSLIEVLKTIAVTQFKALESKVKPFEKLSLALDGFFELINMEKIRHPFLGAYSSNKGALVVAITSDTGLLGGLNMQVVNQALLELEKNPGRLIIVGERGKVYAQESGVSFAAFSGIRDEERHAQAMQLRDYCLEKVLSGAYSFLKVVYPHPFSFSQQRVEVKSFLPYVLPEKYKTLTQKAFKEVAMESSAEDIAEYLIYLWAGEKFHEVFGLSRLAEFAARFMHLEGSVQRLKEKDKQMQLEYFSARHELIDRNMRELFAAKLAFK